MTSPADSHSELSAASTLKSTGLGVASGGTPPSPEYGLGSRTPIMHRHFSAASSLCDDLPNRPPPQGMMSTFAWLGTICIPAGKLSLLCDVMLIRWAIPFPSAL